MTPEVILEVSIGPHHGPHLQQERGELLFHRCKESGCIGNDGELPGFVDLGEDGSEASLKILGSCGCVDNQGILLVGVGEGQNWSAA